MSLLRSGVAAGLMSIAPLLVVIATPLDKLSELRPAFDLEKAVPKQLGQWRVDQSQMPIPMAGDTLDSLKPTYDQIVHRTYVNPQGERVMLSVAYGSSQARELRIHRQEVCYSAQGFTVTGLERMPLKLKVGDVSTTRFFATRGSRQEPVTYWFTIGDEVVRGLAEREIAQLRYALSGYIPDGYLVRISSLSNDATGAYAKHAEFAGALIQSFDPILRSRMLGLVGEP